MILLRSEARPTQAWKNGAGITQTVLVDQDLQPGWRVSVAAIDRDAPFSVFPGMDRFLAPLTPYGIQLAIGDQRIHVPQYSVAKFDGGEKSACMGVVEAGRDLNLMVDRHLWRGSIMAMQVEVQASIPSTTDGETIVFAPAGGIQTELGPLGIDDAIALGSRDTSISGSATILIARVWPR
jgi:environmental stress-induced protein Ves